MKKLKLTNREVFEMMAQLDLPPFPGCSFSDPFFVATIAILAARHAVKEIAKMKEADENDTP